MIKEKTIAELLSELTPKQREELRQEMMLKEAKASAELSTIKVTKETK